MDCTRIVARAIRSIHMYSYGLNCKLKIFCSTTYIGLHPCDRRVSITEHSKEYPYVSFKEIQSDVDPLYHVYSTREPDEIVSARITEFLQWLANRPEREIIIVTHSAYLRRMLADVMHVEDPSPTHFQNCEMRTYTLTFPDGFK